MCDAVDTPVCFSGQRTTEPHVYLTLQATCDKATRLFISRPSRDKVTRLFTFRPACDKATRLFASIGGVR